MRPRPSDKDFYLWIDEGDRNAGDRIHQWASESPDNTAYVVDSIESSWRDWHYNGATRPSRDAMEWWHLATALSAHWRPLCHSDWDQERD